MSSMQMAQFARGRGPIRFDDPFPAEVINLAANTQRLTPKDLDRTKGDIIGFIFKIEDLDVTGSLSNEKTLAHALNAVTVSNNRGEDLIPQLPGNRLVTVARKRGKGVLNTAPTVSGSNQSYEMFVPWPIRQEDINKLQITIEAEDVLATGGTGGDFTLEVRTVHQFGAVGASLRAAYSSDTLLVGDKRLEDHLTEAAEIEDLYLFTDETDVTELRFTKDGKEEIVYDVDDITALDDHLISAQHVTDELEIYAEPFRRSTATALKVTATAANSVDILQLFVPLDEMPE